MSAACRSSTMSRRRGFRAWARRRPWSPWRADQLQVLVDRSSIEIFTGDGRVNMAYCFLPPASDKSLAVFAQGGEATVRSLEVWELKSTWPK